MKLWPTITENKCFVKMLWHLLGEYVKATIFLLCSICTIHCFLFLYLVRGGLRGLIYVFLPWLKDREDVTCKNTSSCCECAICRCWCNNVNTGKFIASYGYLPVCLVIRELPMYGELPNLHHIRKKWTLDFHYIVTYIFQVIS